MGICNLDLALLVCTQIARCDHQQTVSIDLKCDLDLRSSRFGGWDAFEKKFADLKIVLWVLGLSLEDLDANDILIVLNGGEVVAFANWNTCVLANNGRKMED